MDKEARPSGRKIAERKRQETAAKEGAKDLRGVEGGRSRPIEAPASVPRGDERILLVDDQDIQVRTMMAMLERLGYEAVGLTDAREALREFERRPEDFDLVITDQNMPFTGEKFAGEILRLRPGIPVILCTGYSAQVDEETAKSMGIREFVMKPFSLQEIAMIIRRVLDTRWKTAPAEKG